MNKEEAERAFENGLKELNENKNYKKALVFFSISNRLAPSPETSRRIAECTRAQSSPQAHDPSPASPSISSYVESIYSATKKHLLWAKERMLHYEHRFIAESYKQIIRAVTLLIILVVIFKFIFKQSLSLGHLPGDINYSSSGVHVFAPMTTCSLLSFICPIIYNWYRDVRRL